MKLASIREENQEKVAIILPQGIIKLSTLNNLLETSWEVTLDRIFTEDQFFRLKEWFTEKLPDIDQLPASEFINPADITFGPLFHSPGKIWGIGLNYRAHASDLAEHRAPEEFPGSFMKAATTIIGPGDQIRIPRLSQKTTGEGELGVIIGKKCKEVSASNYLEVVAGFTTIIDMTAEDILRKNVRYLTLCKNFDTFFAFGPVLITPDEIPEVRDLKVATVRNGEIFAENVVSNMTFPPDRLVEFHSQVMTLLPGDIISTGTPRAVPLSHGDIVECRISGFPPLRNPVIDLKHNAPQS